MTGKDEESTNTFRVKDRRRFDNEGNERSEEQGTPSVSPSSVTQPSWGPSPSSSVHGADAGPKVDAKFDSHTLSDDGGGDLGDDAGFTMSDAPEGEEGGIDFSSFVMSLATQALVQLGEMQPPSGMEIPIDREAAHQTIEIIAMLSRKTRGNLSAVEAKLLEDILHNLRMSYVTAGQ